ncbi:heavy metal sensor histidine kinase [Pandoraea sp. XJJ-1]|uniref:Sensor protein n=1 Tax=Pandoraea cepalis TaxID=2508294 RepID=A0AAW7MG54_9BURK|nr:MULTISPECIES: heavy metal sensor histidine kinase [Pandoraea]MDN4571712.1 two-component sensor histidine kinase [Pandoraea cepalis]MDN4576560.1 two-component sensor histidine kinase [Pandoraea cepalis]WAL84918.1 heavy metal sensor histidine kinase [Pandoraea sp. XJJ-1]
MRLIRPKSLTFRLTAAFGVVAVLVFALSSTFLYRSLAAQLERRDDLEIIGKLTQFQSILKESKSESGVMRDSHIFLDVVASHPGLSMALRDMSGKVLVSSSAGMSAELLDRLGLASNAGAPFDLTFDGQQKARAIAFIERLADGTRIQIIFIRSSKDRSELLAVYRQDLWGAAAAGAMLVGILGYAVTRTGLRPVKDIGMQTHSIEASRLSERLKIALAPDELQDIAEAINRMLDRLEDAFRRLTQFSSDIAHDIRTPLSNLISSTQVTLSRPRTLDEYQSLLESHMEEYDRLRRMVENMLFLARADNAKHALRLEWLDANTELTNIASYFEAVAEERELCIRVSAEGLIFADPTLLRRAVSNLVSNALVFSTQGTCIELHSRMLGRETIISVCNQGQDIPGEHLERLFDRFYRADASRHTSAGNSGLGLSIVKSIMELHHGNVQAESQHGTTTFFLTFPGGEVQRGCVRRI